MKRNFTVNVLNIFWKDKLFIYFVLRHQDTRGDKLQKNKLRLFLLSRISRWNKGCRGLLRVREGVKKLMFPNLWNPPALWPSPPRSMLLKTFFIKTIFLYCPAWVQGLKKYLQKKRNNVDFFGPLKGLRGGGSELRRDMSPEKSSFFLLTLSLS